VIVEFSCPHTDLTHFLVSTADEGKQLLAQGVGRGRIWSRKELDTLKVIAGDKAVIAAVVKAKELHDARVQDVVEDATTD
jgi:hypothetical protein